MSLNGVTFEALIDTGSCASIISATVTKKLGLAADGLKLDLVGANQHPLDCHGYAEFELILSMGAVGKITTTAFAVVDKLCIDVLLGHELLGWLEILVSPSRRTILLESEVWGGGGVDRINRDRTPGASRGGCCDSEVSGREAGACDPLAELLKCVSC